MTVGTDIYENVYTRDFKDQDFQALMELWESTDLGNPQRGDNLDVIRRTITMGGKMLVMLEKETKKLIGSSWISYDGRRLYLHHFGILPAFQGKGLSRMLLKESLRFAKEMKTQIKLEVHQNLQHVIQLYTQAGFRYLGNYLVYIIRDPGSIKL